MQKTKSVQETKDEMDAFERELGPSLRQVRAPDGFADRVMLAVEGEAEVQSRGRVRGLTGADAYAGASASTGTLLSFPSRAWLGGALAAGLVLACFGAEQLHGRHERERAMMAERNFAMSEEITAQALEHTREQLKLAGFVVDAQ